MLIILEGPDGSGKTQLAKQLVDMLGWEYVHFSAPVNGVYTHLGKTWLETEMFDMYKEVLERTKTHPAVLDRCWYSERVYGPVLRGESCIWASEVEALERMCLEETKAVLIYTTGNPTALWHNAVRRGEDLVRSWEDYYRIYTSYQKVMANVSLPKLHYIMPGCDGGIHV